MSDQEENLKIEIAIEELRHTLDRLENLNNTLETKASALFGFAAILITVIIFTVNSILSTGLNIILQVIFISSIVIVILIIVSGLIHLLRVIGLRKYIYPFSFDPNKMSKIINVPNEKFKNDIIDDYRQSIPQHHCINQKKVDSLNMAMMRLKIGIFGSFIVLIIFMYIKMIGGLYG